MKVIYIDDDPDEVLIFCEAVRDIDPAIECVGLTDSKCGLEMLSQQASPDLIVLDFNMPGMTGEDCLLAIRSFDHLKNVPVIIYSTGVNETQKQQLLKMGASMIEKKHTSVLAFRAFFIRSFLSKIHHIR